MQKKALILYASMTGNTGKVAGVFQRVLERHAWQCNVVKIESGIDPARPPFSLDEYDFLCVGSPVVGSLPVRDMVNILALNPASPHRMSTGVMGLTMEEIRQRQKQQPKRLVGIAPEPAAADIAPLQIRFGPDAKKGVVFVTFGGVHLGPKEAAPALALLESEMEHLRFQCVGRFACPGRMGRAEGWFKDLPHRPDERDLQKAEIFMRDILEEIRE